MDHGTNRSYDCLVVGAHRGRRQRHDWSSPMSTAYDVIVVGLGPTGLTLATLLGRRGMSVPVLDREPEFYGNAPCGLHGRRGPASVPGRGCRRRAPWRHERRLRSPVGARRRRRHDPVPPEGATPRLAGSEFPVPAVPREQARGASRSVPTCGGAGGAGRSSTSASTRRACRWCMRPQPAPRTADAPASSTMPPGKQSEPSTSLAPTADAASFGSGSASRWSARALSRPDTDPTEVSE